MCMVSKHPITKLTHSPTIYIVSAFLGGALSSLWVHPDSEYIIKYTFFFFWDRNFIK